MNILIERLRPAVLALALTGASFSAAAAPGLRAPATPSAVGDTVTFTVFDNHITDAVDDQTGFEVIDFQFAYAPSTLQYIGAQALRADAFFTAPDLSVDADPQGLFQAAWVLPHDDDTLTDLFTVSFKLLALPATPADAALSLSLPAAGAYGVAGGYEPVSASVSAVPEPSGALLALCALGTLFLTQRKRLG